MTAQPSSPYADAAIASILSEFSAVARPGNIDNPLFAAACRCYEFVNAGAVDVAYVESRLIDIATSAGHSPADTRSALRSAQRTTAGKCAVLPAPTQGQTQGRGYENLAAYAQAQGASLAVFAAAGWSDDLLYEYEYKTRDGSTAIALTHIEPLPFIRIRRALRFTTESSPRWRLIDEDKPKPKYWHPHGTHAGKSKVWYRLPEAFALAVQVGYILLCNGEASVVCAQAHGVPAVAEAGGGERATPPHLLASLRAIWHGPIWIALDGDGAGRKASESKAQQWRQAGADVRVLDLGQGEDLASFVKLHAANSLAALDACPDLTPGTQGSPVAPGAANGAMTQSQQIITTLGSLGYSFRLNQCGMRIEMNGEPMDDIRAAAMRNQLRDIGQKLAPVDDAIGAHALAQAYHPIRDYLTNLVWDGQNHIDILASMMHGPHPLVTYADGQVRPLNQVYLRRWLIAACNRVFNGGQNAVLTFTGAQNLGKSSLAAWLCPGLLRKKYFVQGMVDPHNKDHEIRLMEKFLWEIGELDATTRRADVAALKDFMTREQVDVRRSYGRYPTIGAAMASMIGTVNNQEFLSDDTGNRRFFVIVLDSLDWTYQQLDVDQVWAEAMHRMRSGEPHRLTDEEAGIQTSHNRRFLNDGIVGDYIRAYFCVTHDPAHRMTAAEIVKHLRDCLIPIGSNDKALSMDIARAMSAQGVSKIRDSSGRYYVGIMPKP